MRKGERKIDHNIKADIKTLLESKRWELVPGRKHSHLRLLATNRTIPVAGSSGDNRARLNLIKTIRHMEADAGFTTFSL